jgi:hypothetical protein
MRFAVLAITLAAAAAPACASDAQPATASPVVAHQGDMLRDINNVRVGSVDSVNKDGSVSVIYNSRYITVPAASLSIVNGKLTTRLAKTDLGSL